MKSGELAEKKLLLKYITQNLEATSCALEGKSAIHAIRSAMSVHCKNNVNLVK